MSDQDHSPEGPGDEWLLRTPPHPDDGDELDDDMDEDPTDPWEAKMKAETDSYYGEREAKKRELFAVSAVCAVCPEPIEKLEHATVFTPAGGADVLIHANKGECFIKAIHQCIGRYMKKPRRVA